jgi:hypothetical protein
MDKIKFFCVTNKEVNFIEKENHNLCWVGSGDPPKNYIKCDNKINIYNKERVLFRTNISLLVLEKYATKRN